MRGGNSPTRHRRRHPVTQRKCTPRPAPGFVDVEPVRRCSSRLPAGGAGDALREAFGLEFDRVRHGHEAAVDNQPAGGLDFDPERGQAVAKGRRPNHPGVEIGDAVVDEGGARGLGEDIGATMAFASHQSVGARRFLRRSLANLPVEWRIGEVPVRQTLVDARADDLAVGSP